jgi:microcompartment protein CcmK/EutM
VSQPVKLYCKYNLTVKDVPIDAAVIAIIDSIDVERR